MVFLLLLDRVYAKNESVTHAEVCEFFVDELKMLFNRASDPDNELSMDDLRIISFILTETHSIYSFKPLGITTLNLGAKLARQRYPGDEDQATRDTDFLSSLCDNNVVNFSHYFAHFALTLQMRRDTASQDQSYPLLRLVNRIA